MRQEAWPPVVGHLIEGKTIGVIGLGRIGKEVTRIARAFKARVLATGRTLTEERAREAGAEAVSLETLLRESDIVTIHVPSNPQTRGLIGEKEIALMKPGAVLTDDPAEAVAGANAVYADVWVSMGDEDTADERRRDLEPYRIDDALLAKAAPGAIALHCLPAHPGEEITSDVLYGERQRIWDQAENRRHAQKALLEWLIPAAG